MKFVTLESLCSDIIDCPHSTPKWLDEGIPVIRNFNLINGHIDTSNLSYVDEATYLERIKRANPEEDDIIISREAPMGVVGMVPKGFKCCLGQRLVLLKVNRLKCSPQYLLYALLSDVVQKQINRIDLTGSIVSNLNIPDMKKLLIPVVDGDINKIGEYLNFIDENISNNNKIAQQLEAMTKTIYDYWFLQFEFPNEEGKPYKSSGGKMVWNEELQRDIPEGWKVGNLSNNALTKIIKPGINKFEGTKNYLETADVTESSYTKGEEVTFENRASRANMQPTKNSVWFAKMKDSVKHLLLNEEMQPLIERSIFSTGFLGLQCSSEGFEYIATYIKSEYFEKVKNKLAHGATQQAINNTDLKGIRIVIPSDEVLTEFHDRSKSIYSLISKKNIENKELADMKDFLLPLLMNGQVTVGE